MENEIMTKKEFEESKEPFTLIASLDPKTGKTLFSYFEGWDNDDWLKKFKKDFPKCFHFSRQNKEARRQMCKAIFNYDPFEKEALALNIETQNTNEVKR